MKKTGFTIVAVLLCVSSCTIPQMHNRGLYDGIRLKGGTCVIAPFLGGIDVQYTGSVENELGVGDMKERIAHFVDSSLPVTLARYSGFDEVTIAKSADQGGFKYHPLEIELGNTVPFAIPNLRKPHSFSGLTPEYVCFIEDLRVGTLTSVTASQGSATVGRQLSIEGKVVMWDNVASKLVSYGIVKATSSTFIPMILRHNWEHGIEEFAFKLCLGTPYWNGEEND